MKKILCVLLLLLTGCSSKTSMIEIQKHVYVEKEFLEIFFNSGGKIELYNYSIKKNDLIISGEMIPPKTIRLVHPHLDNVTSEGVIIHELGHYFDEKHQFSSSKQFTKLYKKYRTSFNQKTKKEYFAECFKEYVGGHQEKVKDNYSKNTPKK